MYSPQAILRAKIHEKYSRPISLGLYIITLSYTIITMFEISNYVSNLRDQMVI